MPRQKLLLVICFVISFSGMNGQAIVKAHRYAYHETDYKNCSSLDLDLSYPVFYSSNGNALTFINDSIYKLIGGLDFNGGRPVSSFINDKTDTTIIHPGTIDCDPMTFDPESSNLRYHIFINENQLLSFSITFSYHAGSNGHGSISNAWNFCYDFKEQKWLSFNMLFTDRFDTLLQAKTDSLYLDASDLEAFDVDNYFTGNVGIEPGR